MQPPYLNSTAQPPRSQRVRPVLPAGAQDPVPGLNGVTSIRPSWQTLPPGHGVRSVAVSSGGVTTSTLGTGSQGFDVSLAAGTTVQCNCENACWPGVTVTSCGVAGPRGTFVPIGSTPPLPPSPPRYPHTPPHPPD